MGITRINNNISALTAQRNIDKVGNNLQQSIERLSSGLRINRAADDAAGLVISNRLRSQVEGLNQAVDNASTGINVLNVAEGALEETNVRLNRIRELAVQAANTGVNDFKSRLAIQDEVSQSIDEITRIASTTKFAGNFLLNGDFSIKSELKAGQEFVGANIDASAVASNLNNGTSFLNIRQTQVGRSEIVAGDPADGQQIVSTGIVNQTDIAVSTGIFTSTQFINGTAAVGADALQTSFFNGVSISAAAAGSLAVVTFNGVLSNGETSFNGTVSLTTATSVDDLVSAINSAIDAAETAFFGVSTAASIPTSFRTTAQLGTGNNAGRIELASSGDFFNQSNIDIAVLRNNGIAIKSDGVTRAGALGANSGISGQGAVGNNVTAITGSTFITGEFNISVEDAQAAQQRTVESKIVFRDANGGIISRSSSLSGSTSTRTLVLNGTFDGAVFTGGTTLQEGDTISLLGTNADGTTFSSAFTFDPTTGANDVDAATNLDDFTFASVSGLIQELNFRTRIFSGGSITNGDQARFEDALFTFTANGTLQLIDDLGRTNSQTDFTLTFDLASGPTTLQDNADLIQEGFAEQATFRLNGGEAIRAEAGDVVTLQAEESTIIGVPTSQVTFRVGSGFTNGDDTLINVEDEFVGTLNGGEDVTFGKGDQDVVFLTQGTNTETAKFLTIDFDTIVDATKGVGLNDSGTTVLISTLNRGLNFQIGSDAGQNLEFSVGDLRADNLGFGRGSGRTVQDIDITSLSGAEEAITIVDEALEQVNRTRSILGAATNRLDATISSLSVASENLTASESRIRDADIAAETSRFTLNQVLLQAGTSVLAQANFQSQGFLSLLG